MRRHRVHPLEFTVSMNEWVGQIEAELQSALKDFGECAFNDKGPHEVMDLGEHVTKLKAMTGAEAGSHLQAVCRRGGKMKAIASALLGELDDQPEDWWTACCMQAPDVY